MIDIFMKSFYKWSNTFASNRRNCFIHLVSSSSSSTIPCTCGFNTPKVFTRGIGVTMTPRTEKAWKRKEKQLTRYRGASLERGSQKIFELTDLFRFCFQLFCKCCRYLGSRTNIWIEARERVKPDSLAHVVERVTRPRARWRPTSSMIAANRRVSSVLIVAS